MIEKTILDYLSDSIDVPVYMERPATAPDRFVILQKSGGGELNHICDSMLVVQSYAPTLLDAAVLNETVKTYMKAAAALPDLCRCKLNTDYYFPDPDAKQYRYQAVFDIKHY